MSRRPGRIRRFLTPAARWVGALILFSYGFAKLAGAQFTVLDSQLTTPLGAVSGFALTWYYYSYSAAYGALIAIVQIAGGLLLLFPATSLLGALLLLPVVTNIILIDLFYGIGGLPASVVLLACLLVVAVPHIPRVLRAIVRRESPGRTGPTILRAAGACVLLLVTAGFSYWIANFNNRAPTPIDGEWVAATDEVGVERVFFERNRAHLAVFRDREGQDVYRHFELAPDGTITVWSAWRTKQDRLYSGRRLTDDRIRLVSEQAPRDTLVLRRGS